MRRFSPGVLSRRASPAVRQWMDWLVAGEDPHGRSGAARGPRYGILLGVEVLVTAAFWPLKEGVGLLNIGLVYLVVVVGAAVLGGRGPGLLASVVGFLLFNFFLVPPYLTFIIEDLHNILALVVFLSLAVLISTLIARAREEAAQARRRAGDLQRLYTLGQVALAATRREAVLPALVAQVVEMFGAEAGWLLLPAPGTGADSLQVSAQVPAPARAPTTAEWDLARQTYARGTLPDPGMISGAALPHTLFAPLAAEGRVLGVLGVTAGRRPFAGAEPTVLATLAGQIALALSRLELRAEAERAEVLARTDELKSALLHAVSHDLRTPLASIKTTVTSLLDPTIPWDATIRRVLLEGVDQECDRLTRLVSNLLDMSRIEGDGLHLQRDWYAIGEVIATVRRRLTPRLADHPLTVDVPPDLPLVPLDFVKIDQVLTNLLENAITYTPAGMPIEVRAGLEAGVLVVTVADRGPGVAPTALARLFEPFYRAAAPGAPPGSGLGLAIARGMVRAHGGTITARSSPGEGLAVRFTLPLAIDGAVARAARSGLWESAGGLADGQ